MGTSIPAMINMLLPSVSSALLHRLAACCMATDKDCSLSVIRACESFFNSHTATMVTSANLSMDLPSSIQLVIENMRPKPVMGFSRENCGISASVLKFQPLNDIGARM